MANPTANKPANATNKAPVSGAAKAGSDDMPEFDKWTDRQIGFAPYWAPDPTNFLYGQILARDSRNPTFVRYLFKALRDTKCRRGPQNNATENGVVGEDLVVKKGETLSMSVFYSLQDEFDFQLWMHKKKSIDVPIRVDALKKVDTNTIDDETGKPRQVWQFRVRCAPENSKILEQHQDEWRRLQEGGEERPAMET